jgi:hypothetical protein
MNPIACSKYLCLLIVLLAAVVPPATCAEKLNSYHNEEFRFSFQYPASWVERPGSVPNLRVKVAAPANTQAAECAVVVKRFPKATSAKQSDIDQIFLVPPTPSEIEEVFSQANNDFKVSKAGTGTLHSHPAHIARVKYKTAENSYASGRVLMTATPGLTWTLSCSGLGGTPAEAEKNYQFWEGKINNLVSSFKFM